LVSRDSLREAVLRVNHALGDAPREFGLHPRQRGGGQILVAGGERRFDLLDESADAADARAVDDRRGASATECVYVPVAYSTMGYD
jgi:hypothetical protein